MPNLTLSKSSFLKGLQCLKALYLSKYRPELKDPVPLEQQAIFEKGTKVGIIARQLFPGGANPSKSLPVNYKKCIEDTRKLVEENAGVIYEAGFEFENLVCFVDILVGNNGKWKAYEVKSSTSLSEVHLWDAAFQYYVLVHSGLVIENFSLVYINNQYERLGELDLGQLFIIDPQIRKVLELQDQVSENVNVLKNMLRAAVEPALDIGPYCTTPYECDFRGHCWKHIPGNSVFDIGGLSGYKKWDLYKQGIIEFKDIPPFYSLNTKQWWQVESAVSQSAYINKEQITKFTRDLRYPLYFLDFESFQPAVPLFDRSRPYQQIPFQYSLHVLDKPGGNLTHAEFLAQVPGDPRPDFIESLLGRLGKSGNIVVYNRAFEATRLQEIERDFPDYSDEIKMLLPRIKDLMQPFQQGHYYSPLMNGSYSIKQVLPALSPEFNYESMTISNGSSASLAFESLYDETDLVRIADIRTGLLEYCMMDTLAMVEILYALQKIAG
jgi:hypothetical protein